MKTSPLYIILLLLFSTCKSYQQSDITYHPIVQKAMKTSLYTKQVDWEVVNKKFVELTQGKEDPEGLKEGLEYLINSLGDKHGQFRNSSDYSIIASYTGPRSGDDNRKGQFINEVINDITLKFSYQLIDDNIGYLRVYGIGPGVVKEQADFIRQGLIDLKKEGVNKWILDLRYNGGGNIEPMIAGLSPLIGEGFVGGAINIRNEIRPYEIKEGLSYNYNRLICEMEDIPKINPDEKVAVLLSRYTASSGEMLAITFKGRENTKFIGEATAGYVTGNGFDPISDEIVMIISQDIFIDRNKVKYEKNVAVDEYSEFAHNTQIENDKQITLAKTWLNK